MSIGPGHMGRSADRHEGEWIVDVASTSAALDGAKAAVAEGIREEVARNVAISRRARVQRVRLRLTESMVTPLEELYQWAREEAVREIERLGLSPLTTFDTTPVNPDHVVPEIRPVVMRLAFDLGQLEGSVERGLRDAADVIGTIPAMAARRLAEVPGALDAASYLVSPAYVAGLDDVYRANAGLFGGWLYSAVLDRATCDTCRSLDGSTYATLDELYAVLPDFGPNPSCRGGSRCRCRGVPLP